MGFSNVLFFVLAVCAVMGGLDRILGNRFGLGAQFEEGFQAMVTLSLFMVGSYCLSPYIMVFLDVAVAPVFRWMGADPAMAASILISADAGGYPLAHAIAQTPRLADFSVFTVGTTLAPTLGFLIPVGMAACSRRDILVFSVGLVSGLIGMPVGAFVGGLMFGVAPVEVARNLLPIVLFATLIAAAMLRFPTATVRIFAGYARAFTALVTFGLTVAIFQELTGVVVLQKLLPTDEVFAIIADIALVLAGAYPLVYMLTRLLDYRADWISARLGINSFAVAGMLASTANLIPTVGLLGKMDARGKAMCVAFSCGACYVFGDFVGFCAAVSPQALFPMVVSKLVSAGCGVLACAVLYRVIIGKESGDVGCGED